MTVQLKHDALIRRVITAIANDALDFDEEARNGYIEHAIGIFGQQMDIDIEKGIANGYTPEMQEEILKQVLPIRWNA